MGDIAPRKATAVSMTHGVEVFERHEEADEHTAIFALQQMDVTLPDIRLDPSSCFWGSVSEDQCSLVNYHSFHQYNSGLTSYTFAGARDTTALMGRCYWQVKFQLFARFNLRGWCTLCEAGVATRQAMDNSFISITPSFDAALTLQLVIEDYRLKVFSIYKDTELDEFNFGPYDSTAPIEMTFGFMLDSATGRFVGAEVCKRTKLFDFALDVSSPLYPVVALITPGRPAEVLTSLTVESGHLLDKTSSLAEVLDMMLNEEIETEELSE